jgi:hypothetical protein
MLFEVQRTPESRPSMSTLPESLTELTAATTNLTKETRRWTIPSRRSAYLRQQVC